MTSSGPSSRAAAAAAPAAPPSTPADAVGVTWRELPNGAPQITVTVQTPAEGRRALAALKAATRQLTLRKRQITGRQQEIRAGYTDRVRRRPAAARGGGLIGQVVRWMEARSRAEDRKALAKALAPWERERAQVERWLTEFRRVILELEDAPATRPS